MSTIPTETKARLNLASMIQAARANGATWAEVTEDYDLSESTGRKLLTELEEANAEPKKPVVRSGRYAKLVHPKTGLCDADGMTVRTSATVIGVGLSCIGCDAAYIEG